MITYETYCQIRLLHGQRQLTASQIAAELQLDIKTVCRTLNNALPGLDHALPCCRDVSRSLGRPMTMAATAR